MSVELGFSAPSKPTKSVKPTNPRDFYAAVMTALDKLDVIDADFCGEIQHGPVTISVGLVDSEIRDAIGHGFTAIRCAIHEAGGTTADWPNCGDLHPEPDGKGKWVARYLRSSQEPALTPA